jgi:hypothetical protein
MHDHCSVLEGTHNMHDHCSVLEGTHLEGTHNMHPLPSTCRTSRAHEGCDADKQHPTPSPPTNPNTCP